MSQSRQSSTGTLPALKDLFPEHFNPGSPSSSSHHSPPFPPANLHILPHPHGTAVYRSPVFTNTLSQPYHHPSHHPQSAGPYRTQHNHHHGHGQYYDERIGYGYGGSYGHRTMRGDLEADDELGDDHDGSDPEAGGSASEKRRHPCPRCGKRFNRPSSLKIHLNTHTGAKPFDCPFPGCGRSFNVSSNMRRHLRNHTKRPSQSSQSSQPGGSAANAYPGAGDQSSSPGTAVNNPNSTNTTFQPSGGARLLGNRSAAAAPQPIAPSPSVVTAPRGEGRHMTHLDGHGQGGAWGVREEYRYPHAYPPSPSPSPPTPPYLNGGPSPRGAYGLDGTDGVRRGGVGVDRERGIERVLERERERERDTWGVGSDDGSDEGSVEGYGSGWSSNGHGHGHGHGFSHAETGRLVPAYSCTRTSSSSSAYSGTASGAAYQHHQLQQPSPVTPSLRPLYPDEPTSSSSSHDVTSPRKGHHRTSSSTSSVVAKLGAASFGFGSGAVSPPAGKSQFPMYTFPPPPPVSVGGASGSGSGRSGRL